MIESLLLISFGCIKTKIQCTLAMANTAADTVTSAANKEDQVSNSSDESVSNFFSNHLLRACGYHDKSNSIKIVFVRDYSHTFSTGLLLTAVAESHPPPGSHVNQVPQPA